MIKRISIKSKKLIVLRRYIQNKLLILSVILFAFVTSCESDPYGSHYSGENTLTIYQYLEANQKDFSEFYQLLGQGKMLVPLGAYNPYGDGYTLFLPTDDAIDHFIQQNPKYENFESLLQDTSFLHSFTRYHTVKRKVHTDEFPFGAMTDSTLTGDRLVIGFYSDGDNQIIKVNNEAPIIKPNIELTNGYIHVISEVLQKADVSGYDWLQQHQDYSILAEAMELSGVRQKLWFNKYTILAENDSIYYKNGIMNIRDLISRLTPPGASNSVVSNSLYQFSTYHILYKDFYLNDLRWGSNTYWTQNNKSVVIDVGAVIKINPGVDIIDVIISESGDTTIVDYVQPVLEGCNNITSTGPVHSISDILVSEPLPY